MDEATPHYWFNVDTHQVQTNATKDQGMHLLGPYPTFEEAAAALQTARQRTEAWDEQEAQEQDDNDV